MKQSALWVASLWLATSFVYAQVEVVDRPISPSTSSSAPSNSFPSAPVTTTQVGTSVERPSADPAQVSSNNAAEMFYQFQVMQQELLELRGLVEQQSNEIKKLKQQRLDDYVDLDRRISGLSSGSASASASSVSTPTSSVSPQVSTRPSTPAVSNSASSPASEIAHYKSATKLVLMDRDYDAGIARLKEHLELYPSGRYKGNAQYWLGEVYLAKGDLSAAKQWFETLLGDFPSHAKISDAKYKLGTALHQLGDTEEARSLLLDVRSSAGSAANLADKYLNTHF